MNALTRMLHCRGIRCGECGAWGSREYTRRNWKPKVVRGRTTGYYKKRMVGRVGRPCTHISPEQKVSESSFSLPSTAQAVHVDGLCYNIFNINRSVI